MTIKTKARRRLNLNDVNDTIIKSHLTKRNGMGKRADTEERSLRGEWIHFTKHDTLLHSSPNTTFDLSHLRLFFFLLLCLLGRGAVEDLGCPELLGSEALASSSYFYSFSLFTSAALSASSTLASSSLGMYYAGSSAVIWAFSFSTLIGWVNSASFPWVIFVLLFSTLFIYSVSFSISILLTGFDSVWIGIPFTSSETVSSSWSWLFPFSAAADSGWSS